MKKKRLRDRVSYEDLSDHDKREIDKFKQFLQIQASRKAGGDPAVLATLEQALYPDVDMSRGRPIGEA